jgi:hypothetical protein
LDTIKDWNMNINSPIVSTRRQLHREFARLTNTVPGQNYVAYKNFLYTKNTTIDGSGRISNSSFPHVAELPYGKADKINEMWQWLQSTYGNPSPGSRAAWIYLEHSRSKNYVRFGFIREQDRNWCLLTWQ